MYFNHSRRENTIVPDMWCKNIIYDYKSPLFPAKMGVYVKKSKKENIYGINHNNSIT